MREMTNEEEQCVSGGALPVVAAAASFFGHAGVRSVSQYVIGRALTVYAVYNGAVSVSEVKDN